MEVQQLLSMRETDIETLVLWRVFGIFLFTSLNSLSVLKLSMLICRLTKSQATCAPLFLFNKMCFHSFWGKKIELAALENVYVSCQMSLVKVMWEVPSFVLISQRMKTNGPCLDVNLNPVFCRTLQGVLPPHFFASYFFFKGKDISNVSSHDPLCLFCLVLAYVYQLTYPIFFFFLSSPSSTRCQKQERLNLL